MTALRLLADLRARGVRVEAPAPDRLRLVVPSGALDPEELERLRPRKDELLAALLAERSQRPERGVPIEFITSAPVVAIRGEPGAVLVVSERYGEVWLLLAPQLEAAISAEERAREVRGEAPRPLLHVADVARLRGMPEVIVRAVLEASRTFSGVRVIQ